MCGGRTGEGWLYLALIPDLHSRCAVGWATSERITEALIPDALGQALARRRPPQGLVHHSGRGSQYASGDSTTRRYDGQRPHWALGYLSPRAFERGHELDAAATT